MRVRPAAVAGRFYHADRGRLAREIAGYLCDQPVVLPPFAQRYAAVSAAGARRPRALVVPHAGYVYSGPTAGVAYRTLPRLADSLDRVVLLGPAHYVPVAGIAASSADVWETPLGDARLDTRAREDLLRRSRGSGGDAGPGGDAGHGADGDGGDGAGGGRRPATGPVVEVDDLAHEPEHSLEVQVPFLQTVLPGVPLVPLLVGTSDADGVAALLDPWWRDDRTLIVVSSDLSHYEPVSVAREQDARTADAVCRADAYAVGDRDACGCRPLRAVLRLAARDGATVRLLDLRTSADTAGDPHRVVGYGAFTLAA